MEDYEKRHVYFNNTKIAMKLSDMCVICGDEGEFHIDDDNAMRIFKSNETPLCKKCATKLARLILEGIEF